MAKQKETQEFEGTINVCAHLVSFRYWEIEHELTTELEAKLTEEAESRAKECIIEGYSSGELNCGSEEITGWWEIQAD